MRESNYQFAAGTIIGGRYSIIRSLGQGGMASVYLAQDMDLGTEVALKLMRGELTDDPEFIKRFATEARAAASLDNPNIVRVLDYGQDGRTRYIVQEYVEGHTLKELIQEHGHLDYRLATPLMIQIGLALEHAHQRGEEDENRVQQEMAPLAARARPIATLHRWLNCGLGSIYRHELLFIAYETRYPQDLCIVKGAVRLGLVMHPALLQPVL